MRHLKACSPVAYVRYPVSLNRLVNEDTVNSQMSSVCCPWLFQDLTHDLRNVRYQEGNEVIAADNQKLRLKYYSIAADRVSNMGVT